MINMNLQKLRKMFSYTQEEVAEKIGVTRQAVSKWESGETTPDLDMCTKLAQMYDVTLDNLVNFNENNLGVPVPPRGKYIFGVVTVGERGQIVIPKKARDTFNISAGDQLLVLGDEDRGIAITKLDDMVKFFGAIGETKNFG